MPSRDTTREAPQQTITRVLREARLRVDPRDIPGFAATFGARDRPGLTQKELAHLLGVTPKWYRNLELGKPLNFSQAFLQSVRRVLVLSDDEWDTVWHLTQGRLLPHSAQERPTREVRQELPPAVRRFIDAQTWPAYLRDHRWDLTAYNAAGVRDFPWMVHGTNVMAWVLTYPEARTQLVDWERDWALPMAAQLRFHVERWSADTGLQAIVRTVQNDPVARALWNSPRLPALSRPRASSTRKLYLPRQGAREFEVTLLTFRVDDIPSSRMVIVVPG